jgi:DNA-directed RNA polymerase subunit alpha
MLWNDFQRPRRLETDAESLTSSYGRFVAQPFERGFATTIGNALRRCLLSSIEGAAITAIRIEGVLHEFSSVPGVKEDVTDIVLNLKEIPVRMHTEGPKIVTLDVKGPRVVTAADLAGDPQVEIVDPTRHIATVNEEGHLQMELQIKHGRGYVAIEKNIDETLGLGWVPLDSVHSPVRRVNYKVETARVGRMTDYEKLRRRFRWRRLCYRNTSRSSSPRTTWRSARSQPPRRTPSCTRSWPRTWTISISR